MVRQERISRLSEKTLWVSEGIWSVQKAKLLLRFLLIGARWEPRAVRCRCPLVVFNRESLRMRPSLSPPCFYLYVSDGIPRTLNPGKTSLVFPLRVKVLQLQSASVLPALISSYFYSLLCQSTQEAWVSQLNSQLSTHS